MAEPLDEAALVCAAALVLDSTPDAVLDRVEVGVLAALVAEVRAADDPVRAAAGLLERVVLERPFPASNAAIGWLAAVDLLRGHGRHVDARPKEVVRLCDAIRAGGVDVVAALRRWTVRSGFACPACGRIVYAFTPSRLVLHGTSRIELTARCAFEHRAHDRRGRRPAIEQRDDTGAATVLARGECGSVAVAIGGRTLIVSPHCDEPRISRVSEVDDVSPGELIGRWDALLARATTVGFIPGDDVRSLA